MGIGCHAVGFFAFLTGSLVASWKAIGCHAVGFFAFLTGSLVASWKAIEPPSSSVASHLPPPSVVPVKFHNYNDSATRIAGRLLVPTIHSRDILFRPRGIILVESSQTRWFSR
jgi:hypothetical protein